jgi:hypothetical protein
MTTTFVDADTCGKRPRAVANGLNTPETGGN